MKSANDQAATIPARIWIELEKAPDVLTGDARRVFMQRQCDLANKMLAKLGDMSHRQFFVQETRHGFIYCFGGNHGYTECADRGEWFNLEYLADTSREKRLRETIADIAMLAAAMGHYSGNSRDDIDDYIEWAKEFETLRITDAEGEEFYTVNGKRDNYMSAVEDFARLKLSDSGHCTADDHEEMMSMLGQCLDDNTRRVIAEACTDYAKRTGGRDKAAAEQIAEIIKL